MKIFRGCVWCLTFLVGNATSQSFLKLVVEYFSSKGIRTVTSTLCHNENNLLLGKQLSQKGIKFDSLPLRSFKEKDVAERLLSRIYKLGVVVDLKCPRSVDLLKTADDFSLFTLSHSLTFWLILTDESSIQTLTSWIEAFKTTESDPVKFILDPYVGQTKPEYLYSINKKVNRDLLDEYRQLHHIRGRRAVLTGNKTQIVDFLETKILLYNQVALAVPVTDASGVEYRLFTVEKPTVEAKPKIEKIGEMKRRSKYTLSLIEDRKKPDFENGLLRAASTILQPEAFTSIDDLATREADLWPKMSHVHVKLLAEDLNFRVVIRFYEDYGWLMPNGSFSHLMGLLQRRQADLSATALLMRPDRFPVVDFLECPFRLQIGVLFREPSLSSVSNIFLLPFSKAIWIAIVFVIVLTVAALRMRAIAGRSLVPPDEDIASYFDLGGYVVGAVCQQGFSTTPKSLSARVSILILLLTSLALFTSYSACIVALLQSSSSAILSVGDITESNLDVGIQANFPLYKVMMKEAAHPVLKEFYKRKVLLKGENAFWERRVGVEKMRTGMFAFEVELTAGYKLISETYEEREKCGIKEIDLVPKPFICVAVRKGSPYKEIFSQRLVWQNEAGLFDRTWKRWVDQKPKCEVGRIGFISVGLTEFRPALQVFFYGIIASCVIFFFELSFHKKSVLKCRQPKVRRKLRY